MKTSVYNAEGKEIETIDLEDRVFNRDWNPDLISQSLRVEEANSRTRIAEAKGRGEVTGGGRKPWRQKHTGRARHGSIRSPLWIKGGVSHGPKAERNYELKINKKAKQAAVFSVLSERLKSGELKVVDAVTDFSKTKDLSQWLKGFFAALKSEKKGKLSVLLISGDNHREIRRTGRNLKDFKSLSPRSLNVRDLLRYREILLEKEASKTLTEHYHA